MALQHQGMISSGAGVVGCGCDGGMVTMLSIQYGGSIPDTARQSSAMNLNSPLAYQELSSVEAGQFLYLKPSASLTVRLTQTGIVQGDPDVETVMKLGIGATILNFPTEQPLIKLEVQGSGALEYLVAGLK